MLTVLDVGYSYRCMRCLSVYVLDTTVALQKRLNRSRCRFRYRLVGPTNHGQWRHMANMIGTQCISTETFTCSSQRLTIRHDARFPLCSRIRRVAPDSVIPVVGRVSTVVAGVVYAYIGKHVVIGVAMSVRRLRCPRLALFAVHRHRYVTDVPTSVRCRAAPYVIPCHTFNR